MGKVLEIVPYLSCKNSKEKDISLLLASEFAKVITNFYEIE